VEKYGFGWLEKAFRQIQEEKYLDYQVWMMMLPIARTPQDKKGGKAMEQYAKQVGRALESLVPWLRKACKARRPVRGNAKPGEVVVVLSGDETANLPVFKDAKVTRV
jgi:hypothetical protein